MGRHFVICPDKHFAEIRYNSCRHRCCPQCAVLERQKWLHRWNNRLLPCPHHHAVFTIPHELSDLWRYNRAKVTNLLMRAVSRTLMELMADPKYCGARPGILAALHTWSQTLATHVHLHVLITAGGLSLSTGRWMAARRKCLLPRQVVMIVFRGKFRALLLAALASGELKLPTGTSACQWFSELNRLGRLPWNVKVFGRYRSGRGVASYLARYLRGGPIGQQRLLRVDAGQVYFRYRVPSQAAGDRSRQAVMKLKITEFLRRYLEHVPPKGLQTVRGYGLYCGNQHSRLDSAFQALGAAAPDREHDQLDVAQWLQSLGIASSGDSCPVCGRKLLVLDRYSRGPRGRVVRGPPTPARVNSEPQVPA